MSSVSQAVVFGAIFRATRLVRWNTEWDVNIERRAGNLETIDIALHAVLFNRPGIANEFYRETVKALVARPKLDW